MTIKHHVWVYGPNLVDQSKGQFHVHAAGCSSVPAGFAGPQEPWSLLNAESQKQVTTDVYPPGDFGYNPDEEWRDYCDIWFAPCVDLPEE
jgi:hypothetical protein